MTAKFAVLIGLLTLLFPIESRAVSEVELLKNPTYKSLKQALLHYEKLDDQPWPKIRTLRNLELGMSDPQVVSVKKRLKITGELGLSADTSDPFFDKALRDAVEEFQRNHAMSADGIVGPETRDALNVTPQQRVHQIRVNLKRWAEFIEETESQYIWINIPDYYMRLVDNDHAALTSKVIVGKVTRTTPEIDSHIKQLIVNPTWTVPPTIHIASSLEREALCRRVTLSGVLREAML